MRCLLCLIGFISVLSVFHTNQSCAASPAFSEGREISCLVSTSNPPLSAIENSGSNTSGFTYNSPIYLQKRFGIYFIAGNLSSLRSGELPSNKSDHFLDKSANLFLLNHFSQSLWGVFLI